VEFRAPRIAKIGEICDEKIRYRLVFLTTMVEPAITLSFAIVAAAVIVIFLLVINLMENIYHWHGKN
jgi:type II secretory pathway component PulF